MEAFTFCVNLVVVFNYRVCHEHSTQFQRLRSIWQNRNRTDDECIGHGQSNEPNLYTAQTMAIGNKNFLLCVYMSTLTHTHTSDAERFDHFRCSKTTIWPQDERLLCNCRTEGWLNGIKNKVEGKIVGLVLTGIYIGRELNWRIYSNALWSYLHHRLLDWAKIFDSNRDVFYYFIQHRQRRHTHIHSRRCHRKTIIMCRFIRL